LSCIRRIRAEIAERLKNPERCGGLSQFRRGRVLQPMEGVSPWIDFSAARRAQLFGNVACVGSFRTGWGRRPLPRCQRRSGLGTGTWSSVIYRTSSALVRACRRYGLTAKSGHSGPTRSRSVPVKASVRPAPAAGRASRSRLPNRQSSQAARRAQACLGGNRTP